MSPAIVVHDASGTRRFGEADLPLRIGTGPAAAIRLPGPVADQSHALMGLLEENYRLPMVPPRPETRDKLARVLAALGKVAADRRE